MNLTLYIENDEIGRLVGVVFEKTIKLHKKDWVRGALAFD
jgi:hypothetical protein